MGRAADCLAFVLLIASVPAPGCDRDQNKKRGANKTEGEGSFPSADEVRAKLEAEGPEARFSKITVHSFGTTFTKCPADDPLAVAATDVDWALLPGLVSQTTKKLSIDVSMPVSEVVVARSAPRGPVHFVGSISKFGEVEFDEHGKVVRTRH